MGSDKHRAQKTIQMHEVRSASLRNPCLEKNFGRVSRRFQRMRGGGGGGEMILLHVVVKRFKPKIASS